MSLSRDTDAKVTERTFVLRKEENVFFLLPMIVNQILDNISFSVNKGETIAFVSSEFGKSSIINVFLCVSMSSIRRARVLLDGVDIIRDYNSRKRELRKNIGLVLQEPFLYHGTVKSIIPCQKLIWQLMKKKRD